MKKIMFNDKYGLTDAVLEGRKTMTRRVIPIWQILSFNEDNDPSAIDKEGLVAKHSRYKVGEIVAIAQSYKSIFEKSLNSALPRYHWLDDHIDEKGYANKMFVKAGEMPHHIKITDIKVERLQDISDEDILREGVLQSADGYDFYTFDGWVKRAKGKELPTQIYTKNRREAFAALINKVSGKGTWKSNPYCFCYTFELIE